MEIEYRHLLSWIFITFYLQTFEMGCRVGSFRNYNSVVFIVFRVVQP
jgi:hypothetical protein